MMSQDSVYSSPARTPVTMEPLEERRLLTDWGAWPHFVGQDAAVAKYPALTGKGISVAIIDSGIDWLHPQLGGTYEQPNSKIIAGWDFVTNTDNPIDQFGHGTGVAGILAANQYVYGSHLYQGVAPGVSLIDLRADSQVAGEVYDAHRYEAALQWVIAHRDQYNIQAVDMTDFGGAWFYNTPHTQSPFSDELATLAGMGVFIGCPAGNELINQGTGIKYPAADPNVIGVGGSTLGDQVFIYSQRGPLLHMLAPGQGVITPYYDATHNRAVIIDYADGTSFATPWIVGTAALIKQINPKFTPSQILSIMEDSGVPVYDSLTGLTFKRLNIVGALDLAYARNTEAGDTMVFSGGLDNSMVYDSTGRLDLAYFDATANVLKFVSRAPNGVWGSAQTVDSLAGAGRYPSIGVDNTNLPGIAYYDPNNGDLKYAQFNGTSWDNVIVDSYRTTGLYPSLAFDPASWPVVSYYNKTYGDLKLAAFDGHQWNIQTLDATGDVGRYSSLKMNPAAGRWAVSYIDVTGNSTNFAQQTRHGWAFSTVDVLTLAGGYTSLAFDNTDQPAISYYDAYNADLKFAHYQSSRWNVQTVVSKSSQGLYTTLMFNPVDGKANITYYYRNAASVCLAVGDIGSWQLSTAASGGGTYAFSAMSPTTHMIAVCYLDKDLPELKVVDL